MTSPAVQKAADALRPEKMTDLKDRVLKFNISELPGQPLGVHMGTSYLVNDLWRTVEALAALEAEDAQHPSHEAIEAAVCLEIQSAIGRVTTEAIGRLIDQAMFVRSMKTGKAKP